MSENIIIYPRQEDVSPFFNGASVVVNLSDKKRFIETFGLTALEAMSAGLPVIVPTEGGIAEMIQDGVNGYKIDVSELDQIEKMIHLILSERDVYIKVSDAAYEYSKTYNESGMIERLSSIINKELSE